MKRQKNKTEVFFVTACNAKQATHIHQSKLEQLIGMAPSRGCGVCKALFGAKKKERTEKTG